MFIKNILTSLLSSIRKMGFRFHFVPRHSMVHLRFINFGTQKGPNLQMKFSSNLILSKKN